ncbi:hypothetical protein L218DRAFT_888608 [Marasmius fiardii PR-910]|nr:hypothetical protein L218DRAFT_888608 [Marasmius fiardii PR-910]
MSQTGLLQWGNSIRFLMVNDSGRESFQQQINTHGFIFLDDYLNNILARPNQDTLIDLVKTPSRKRNHSQKSKVNLSPSRLRTVVSLEDDGDKENTILANSLHKALLQAKEKEDHQSRPIVSPGAPAESHASVYHPVSVHKLESDIPETPIVSVAPIEDFMEMAEHHIPVELSVIAEDDEPADRSRMSSHLSPGKLSKSLQPEEMPEVAEQENPPKTVQSPVAEGSLHTADATMSSVDTFHTTPLAPSINSLLPSVGETEKQHVAEDLPVEMEVERNPTQESQIEADDPTSSLAGAKGEEHTSTLPVFPPLPAPIPIRKSVRVPRETSAEPGPLGSATPGATIAKRTSWLMKSREVKALETGNNKTTNIVTGGSHTSTLPGVPNPHKRKSGDMLGAGVPGMARQDDGERAAKLSKKADGDVISRKAGDKEQPEVQAEFNSESDGHMLGPQGGEQKGMLDQFKKTVEGLGVRFGKSTGKSLGGGLLSNALAEARAAAEAKVALKNRRGEDVTMEELSLTKCTELTSTESQGTDVPIVAESPSAGSSLQRQEPGSRVVEIVESPRQSSHSRLSVSDLAAPETFKEQATKRKNIFSLFPPEHENKLLSQTNKLPAATPISPFSKLFDKTSPVFVPPSPLPATSKPSSPPVFTKPPSITVGLSPRLPASPPMGQQKRPPLSPQSTWDSLSSGTSEKVFGSQEPPAWMPSSQDTEFSAPYESQPQQLDQSDEDDSWPIDGKLGDKIKQWPFGMALNNDRDSLTWSSAPTDSQKLDTNVDEVDLTHNHDKGSSTHGHNVPGSFCMDVDDNEETDNNACDMSIDLGKSTVGLVESTASQPDRSIPLSSSQTQAQSQPSQGFFGHATKLVSSALGTNKKPKTEVKSLQLAAAAAKKQQEEKDKKATVLKNMESRRQLVLQKKAEEEKTRQLEEEKKIKEEAERRKREREELTGKIPVKLTVKREEDVTGKRKIELKKPAAGGLNSSTSLKPTFKPVVKSTPSTASGPSNIGMMPANSMSKMKVKTPAKGGDEDFSQPSQVIQNQMSARAKAQIQASKQTEPVIPSESIELPEINSEYSDSDDEDRKRTFDPPDWAQSPELRQALQMQSTINPDEIFGAIQPLRMEEIFRNGRTSRFRPRSSSANWNGTDRLTAEEEREYARRMGFR